MAIHISARMAWHMEGWEGRICNHPVGNTYCVGQYTFPGTMSADPRDLAWETANGGREVAGLETAPPCVMSINAFGQKTMTAWADPPEFFYDDTARRLWDMPPSTVSVWPYEEMYADDVKREGGSYDNNLRLKKATEYFSVIEPDKSLIVYYANYSNPLNPEDERRYAIIGLSRIKSVGEPLFFENVSARALEQFGGYVWARNVTSHYPDAGMRIPYHKYLDQPEVLERIAFFPENTRNFKYATRHMSDDDALVLVERFLEIAATLRELGDKTENWSLRIEWLETLIAELWDSRGLYPGLPSVLDYLQFQDAISFFKKRVAAADEESARQAIFIFLEGKSKEIAGLPLSPDVSRRVSRQWQLRSDDERRLLREVLPRFDLRVTQIEHVLAPDRDSYCILASLEQIAENPYVLCEQYVGNGPDDSIPFRKIDNGMFPSPVLGGQELAGRDDATRLRALCVDRLQKEPSHTFLPADRVIHDVNHTLSFAPEWKRQQFTERYLEVDADTLEQALTLREEAGKKYLYQKLVYDAERDIETALRDLMLRPDITLSAPVTEEHWRSFLHDPASPLNKRNPGEYRAAIDGQIGVCQSVFVRPVSVVTGAAGTGKTTIIKALVRAIEKTHGSGTSFQLLAPTGKATERVRELTGKSASTLHSFLAQRGWLNDNGTYRQKGQKREEGVKTIIVDEASMLDQDLAAALFRSVNWNVVQRLIFVGDQNQLPPIGRGKVFADIIDWLREADPKGLGLLLINIRQMENRLKEEGTGIIDLASLYMRARPGTDVLESDSGSAEDLLKRVQDGGDVDKDLRVLYWHDAADLTQQLIQTIVADVEHDTGVSFDPDRPHELWRAAFGDFGGHETKEPERLQVITPYRGELFGTGHLNTVIQQHAKGRRLSEAKLLGGIALFDKVIQVVNRPRSNRIWGYDTTTRKNGPFEIFNGELGFTKPRDKNWQKGRLREFQVIFSRRSHVWIEYGSESDVNENIELAYAISVHKAQGSEFGRVYFVLPKSKQALLSPELFYTGLTRASKHCTLLVEEDIAPLLTLRRLENSRLLTINSSLFAFRPVSEALQDRRSWYEEGKIHETLTSDMVRSKSEVIIANMLCERDIPFKYEIRLTAPDGTFFLPDFTIEARGETWYWEHLGRLDSDDYRNHWQTKQDWYDKHFPGRLLTTRESPTLSQEASELIARHFA